MTCCGVHKYDSASELFTLVKPESNLVVLRSLDDFKRLNRSCPEVKGFPMKSFKKLISCGSWTKDGSDWNPVLTRSVALANEWLQKVCEECHTAYDDFLDEDIYASLKKRRISQRQLESESRRLQQYFTTDKNLILLMSLVCGGISQPLEDILFIEPSCGDGRIVDALIGAGARKLFVCDIDSELVSRVRNLLLTNNKLSSENVIVTTQDFLTTSPASLVNSSSNNSSNSCGRTSYKIAVGNPPYSIRNILNDSTVPSSTIDGIDGDDEDGDDGALLFIVHCACVLRVDRIVFVLPERCDKSTFINKVLHHLNVSTPGESDEMEKRKIWYLKQSIPADSSFDLLGRIVKQPSVVQVWDCK